MNSIKAYLSAIGRKGGQSKSAAKKAAARRNAKLPRKKIIQTAQDGAALKDHPGKVVKRKIYGYFIEYNIRMPFS